MLSTEHVYSGMGRQDVNYRILKYFYTNMNRFIGLMNKIIILCCRCSESILLYNEFFVEGPFSSTNLQI